MGLFEMIDFADMLRRMGELEPGAFARRNLPFSPSISTPPCARISESLVSSIS
jgi:hypothetical protein